ncbi:MAG: hypothetical protein H6740_10215 [Alphaproteobacteria bacterium]|nr:hypothetical protein [Alphaproteobacteria bacterium]
MKVSRNEDWRAFLAAPEQPWFTGLRVKDRRHEALTPGGRCRLTLFEAAPEGERAHPRLRTEMPPAVDPNERERLFARPATAPAELGALTEALQSAVAAAQDKLKLADLDADTAPTGSERYWYNSIRAQRVTRLFGEIRGAVAAWIAAGDFPRAEGPAARALVRRLESEQLAGELRFDDGDTNTYHSYGHDKPFVHYLEAMLKSLPEEGGEAFAVLDPDQQQALRRQRKQIQHHLDHLMRFKYANEGIIETDIERSLGGLMIDRETRQIVSEPPDSLDELVPRYELLRIDPAAEHAHAGAWVYRDGAHLRLEGGFEVRVDPEDLRSTPVKADQVTFRRAPHDARLRKNMRLDWDRSGYVRQGKVEWVSWAGHCDIKAIMEALGLAFDGPPGSRPSVREYRSDTAQITDYSRDLIIEMIASAMELGSVYQRADGSGRIVRGVHHFGGSRNDSRPDRLQFEGLRQGRHFRWPLSSRQESFVVTGIELDGEDLDVDTAFLRYLPDVTAVDFKDNPRYLKTVEGDYNLIDVSGAVVRARVKVDSFDPFTGYPEQEAQDIRLDLREGASERRQYLGTHMKDAAGRELYQLWLDLDARRIEAIPERWRKGADGRWAAEPNERETVRIPLARGLKVTLSREMKSDDPELLQNLLDIAIRQAQNICADTDEAAEVWNGVVTRIFSEKLGENLDARVEHWRVDIKARFGRATLEYLLRLDAEGHSEAYCPVPGRRAPDFLWQDFPDVGSKGMEGGAWVVNETMLERGIVEKEYAPHVEGRYYVHDDQIKNVYELLWAGLSGHRYTIVHANKRYAFESKDAWDAAVLELEALREKLVFS